MSDTELLNALEALLRSEDLMIEFWFDGVGFHIFLTDEVKGNSLRAALTDLIKERTGRAT